MRYKKGYRLLAFLLAMTMLFGSRGMESRIQVKAQETKAVDGDFTIVIPIYTQETSETNVIDLTPTEDTSDTSQITVTSDTTQVPPVSTQTPIATTQELKIDKAVGLMVREIKDKQVTLTWQTKYNTASGYQVYRCGQNDVDFESIGTVTEVPANGMITYVDETFVKGVSFTYKVVPYHILNDSQTRMGTESNEITVKSPIEATKIKKCKRTGKKVTLTWKKVSGVTGYEIWRVTNSGKKCIKKVK